MREKDPMPSYRFWESFAAPAWVAGLLGTLIILILAFIYVDNNAMYRFQHDLFASLTGQEKKYDRIDAQNVAGILKKIPKERLAEDFDLMAEMSWPSDPSERIEARNNLIITESGEPKQVKFYYNLIEDQSGDDGNDFRDAINNTSMRAALVEILSGEKTDFWPQPPKLLIQKWSFGQNVLVFIAIIQFIIFLLYSLVCHFENREHPLNLPKEIGPKLAVAACLPGSLPIIILLTIGRRVYQMISKQARLRSYRGATELSPFHLDSALRSRKVLENLRKSIGESR